MISKQVDGPELHNAHLGQLGLANACILYQHDQLCLDVEFKATHCYVISATWQELRAWVPEHMKSGFLWQAQHGVKEGDPENLYIVEQKHCPPNKNNAPMTSLTYKSLDKGRVKSLSLRTVISSQEQAGPNASLMNPSALHSFEAHDHGVW